MGILEDQISLRETGPGTYVASTHPDWAVVNVVVGGCIVAAIHGALVDHLQKQATLNQPDVMNLHVEFLRACEHIDMTITINTLRLGSVASNFQVEVSQNNKVRAVALAQSTNFDRSLGPSASFKWKPVPAPAPKPDFAKALAREPDDNWLPLVVSGDLIPFMGRMLMLTPREGYPVEGVHDIWHGFEGDERIDMATLTYLTDMVPGMSETLLRRGNLFDAHFNNEFAREWAAQNPGLPAVKRNTLSDLLAVETMDQTASITIEYKRRLPAGGVRFVFMRTAMKMLRGGRMDSDVTICDEDGEVLCTAKHVTLVLEAGRKGKRSGKGPSSSL